jgi:hypothetical protein
MLSFGATATTLNGAQTQDNVFGVSNLSKISSWSHDVSMPMWCKLIHPFSSYKKTYTPNHNLNISVLYTFLLIIFELME